MADNNIEIIAQVNEAFNELKNKFTPNKILMTAISGHLHASVMNQFDTEGEGTWPKTMFPGKALQKSGNLVRSIQASATDDTAIVSTNRTGAALMHFGGEVKAKKILGSVKRQRDVWAMEQYFWAMYYKTKKKDKLWMMLALHMQKHNSITVPARPFMVLTQSYADKIVAEINKYII